MGRAPDVRRRVGVDRVRLPWLPGLRVLPVPRVLRGVLRPRVQGAARRVVGDASRPRCARRSATGTTPSAARFSPASAARATLDAHVPSPRVPRSSRRAPPAVFGEPHSLCEQARTPQHQVSGETNPDGWGVGWYRNGDAATRAVTARSPRSGTTTPFAEQSRTIESGAFLGAARLASPGCHHRPERQRALRLGAVALLPQRRGRRVPQGRRRPAAREAERRSASPASKATPTPRCCSRSPSTGSTRATRRARRSSSVVEDRHRDSRRAASTCCSPTAISSRPRATATRCSCAGRPWCRNRSTTSPTGREVPDRSLVSSPRTPTPTPRAHDHAAVASTPIPWPPRSASTSTSSPTRWRARSRPTCVPASSATPKTLPPKWFYDERGSELFDEITRLPEYYPTRAERSILAERADTIAARTGADTLVELGSGTSEKTRLLLDALARRGHAASLRSLRRQRGDAPKRRGCDRTRVRRHRGARRRRRLRTPSRPDSHRRSPRRRVPRQHDRQPRAGRTRRSSSPRWRAAWRPATRCCSAPTS